MGTDLRLAALRRYRTDPQWVKEDCHCKPAAKAAAPAMAVSFSRWLALQRLQRQGVLGVVEVCVDPALLEKLPVGAGLGDTAVGDGDDAACRADGA